jgi:DNA-binding response OmpR family regulator
MILLIENDQLLAEPLYRLLELHGHAVSMAFDGEDALRQIRWQKPELIISDWHLPVLNGLELCRVLRRSSETRGIPFILMSGLPPRHDENTPFDAFIRKPFCAVHLINEVSRLIGFEGEPLAPVPQRERESA